MTERKRHVMNTHVRMIVGLGDQCIFTFSNFLLIVAVAHFSPPHQFGAFSIAYSSYVFASEFAQATCAEPHIIRTSDSEGKRLRSSSEAALGAALALALAIGLVMALVALTLKDPVRTALLLTSFFLPGLIIQGNLRRHFFSEARPGAALVNDILWLAAQTIALLASMTSGHRQVEFLILAWAGTGNIAALIGLIRARVVPRIRSATAWWKQTRKIGMSYAVEYLALAGSAQAIVYMIAATSGLMATAGFRVAITIFGPLNVAVLAARVVGLPEFIRFRSRRYSTYRAAIVWLSLCCGALALTTGLLAMVVAPQLGGLAFGPSWAFAIPLLLPMTIQRTLVALSVGPIIGMRASGATFVSTRARVIGAIVEIVLASIAALKFGAIGAVYGLALGSIVTLVVIYREYQLTERFGAAEGSLGKEPDKATTA